MITMADFSSTTATDEGDQRIPVGQSAAPSLQRELRSYGNYADAQRTVDFLSDQKFPVQHVRIIGHGVTTVEDVHGRMTKGKAALAGAASGAWFGLFVGLIFGLLTPGAIWFALIMLSLVVGALWGAAFGFVGHWATRGTRDFTSARSLVADRYAVMVDTEHHLDAERLLATTR